MASKTKKQQAQATRNTASIAKAQGIDLSKTLSGITSAGVTIQGTLSKISEEIIQKHAELQAVDDSIALKKQDMTNLHGVDQVLLSIDEAKALHAQHLEEQEKEKAQLVQDERDRQAQRAQERAREEETYSYKLQQTRKNDLDGWNEQVRIRTNAERDRQEAFEKDIANREFLLKSKEVDYQNALTKVATFDQEVSKEVKKAEAILGNVLTKDFNHKTEIAAIQHASQVEKLTADNQRFALSAASDAATIQSLQAQLKDAYAKNAELAAKAVEGASNKQAQADALALVTNIGGNGNGARPRS